MSNCRKLWESVHGTIPDGHEVHHIVPKYADGKDVIDNLMLVTPKHHMRLHLERYHELGDFRDLCAYHMIGYNFSEAHKISSAAGGRIGGKIVYENKVGIFRSSEDRRKWASAAGKIGGKLQAERGEGFHKHKTDPELHRSWASKGGKKAFENDPERHRQMSIRGGKKGGIGNKGFIWINDGNKSFKYTKKQQEAQSIDEYLKHNPHIHRGRITCQKLNQSKN